MLPLYFLASCSGPDEVAPPVSTDVAPPPEAIAPVDEIAAPPRANHPPRIGAILLDPPSPTYTDGVSATVDAIDPDGDLLDIDYQWFINDVKEIGSTGPRLPPGRLKKNDTVHVTVTVADDAVEVVEESPRLTVANTIPFFRTQPRDVTRIDGFRFRAEDGDGDTLTWRLEGAPPGMSINDDGIVRYHGSEDDLAGDYTISVIADDGAGWGKFEVPLHVSPGSKAVKAAEEAKRKAAEDAEKK